MLVFAIFSQQQQRSRPGNFGVPKCWILRENTILIEIPFLKAQNDYIFKKFKGTPGYAYDLQPLVVHAVNGKT